MAETNDNFQNNGNRFSAAPPSFSAALGCLEDRLYRCPCCDAEFLNRSVNVSKLSYLGMDSDLRPHYEPIDPILYDIVVCGKCGYGALSKTFDNLSFKQAQVIISQLPSKYRGMCFPQVFSVDIALIRYRTALLCAILTREKSGVIAYLYMRIAWLYRMLGDNEAELKMLAASLEGFSEAVRKDFFPIVDLDEETVYYIMGDYMKRLSMEDSAGHFFTKAYSDKALRRK